MPDGINVKKKSKNFDRNLDATRQKKQLEKNIVFAGEDLKVKSKKYVPIDKGETLSSLKGQKKSPVVYSLSSINWVGSYGKRYTYKTSGVEKNRNKYEWFSRAYKDNQKKYQDYIRKGVYV